MSDLILDGITTSEDKPVMLGQLISKLEVSSDTHWYRFLIGLSFFMIDLSSPSVASDSVAVYILTCVSSVTGTELLIVSTSFSASPLRLSM